MTEGNLSKIHVIAALYDQTKLTKEIEIGMLKKKLHPHSFGDEKMKDEFL